MPSPDTPTPTPAHPAELAPIIDDLAYQPEILFVCVHNAGRPQMAAAIAAHPAPGKVHLRIPATTRRPQPSPMS